eukprot:Tamp_24782.p1 GENE.Tamp_24782~~Tamp_24782.p1  ORF type:complete len:275 (-),score=66.32 Tamp_24782:146-865(-)
MQKEVVAQLIRMLEHPEASPGFGIKQGEEGKITNSPVGKTDKKLQHKKSRSSVPIKSTAAGKKKDKIRNVLPTKKMTANGAAQAPGSFFPKLMRGGGNMRSVKVSSRVIEVRLNSQNVALWEPKESYAAHIAAVNAFIDTMPTEAKDRGAIEHPLLQVSEFRIPLDLSDTIAHHIYGHRKDAKKALSQLFNQLGMVSRTDQKAGVRTLTFSPGDWNWNGLRLIKGGDSKGGRPKIVFVG